ncbi:uncharacterized protein LOC142322825 [Lycorma delicatula]|uniref:uncharacterized protein LOC142322825 n=1 Tax=Lycorma delicatula TaxID=130591 RepID=UPI003F50DC75
MFTKHCSNFKKKLKPEDQEEGYYDVIDTYWNTMQRNKGLRKDVHTQTSNMTIKTECEDMDTDEGLRIEERKKEKRLLQSLLVDKKLKRAKWLCEKSPRNILNTINCISPKKKHEKRKRNERLFKGLNVLNERRKRSRSNLEGRKQRRERIRQHVMRRYHRIV